MSTSAVSHLEALGPASSSEDAARNQRLIDLQMEALGSYRRGAITEQGYKEDKRQETKSFSSIEALRKSNQVGSQENRVASGIQAQLTKWSSAWQELSEDFVLDPNLNSMNDGQTHRLKLMQDPTVREYRECSDSFESASRGRSDRPRGGGRGGRGGGFVGVRIGRHGPGRVPTGMDAEFELPRLKRKGEIPGAALKGKESKQDTRLHEPPKQASRNFIDKPAVGKTKPSLHSSFPQSHMTARAHAGSSAIDRERRAEHGPISTAGIFPQLAPPDDFMAAAQKQFSIPLQTTLSRSSPVAPKAKTSSEQHPQHEKSVISLRIPSMNIDVSIENNQGQSKFRTTAVTPKETISSKPLHHDKETKTKLYEPGISIEVQNDGEEQKDTMSQKPQEPDLQEGLLVRDRNTDVDVLDTAKVIEADHLTNKDDPKVDRKLVSDSTTAKAESSALMDRQNNLVKMKQALEKMYPGIPQALAGQFEALQAQLTAHMAGSLMHEEKTHAERIAQKQRDAGQEITSITTKTALPARPLTSISPRVLSTTVPKLALKTGKAQLVLDTAAGKSNIFGEHIIKERYRSGRGSSISTIARPIESISMGLRKLSLIEQDSNGTASPKALNPKESMITQDAGYVAKDPLTPLNDSVAESRGNDHKSSSIVDTVAMPSYAAAATVNSLMQETVKVSTELIGDNIVRSRFNALKKPYITESAVTRQYSGSTPKNIPPAINTASKYATTNPFAQPSTKEGYQVSAPSNQSEKRSSAKRETSPFAERFPTTPYQWDDAPKRLAKTQATRTPLPAFLQGYKTSKDPGAAARAQYGGMADTRPNLSGMNENRKPLPSEAAKASSEGALR